MRKIFFAVFMILLTVWAIGCTDHVPIKEGVTPNPNGGGLVDVHLGYSTANCQTLRYYHTLLPMSGIMDSGQIVLLMAVLTMCQAQVQMGRSSINSLAIRVPVSINLMFSQIAFGRRMDQKLCLSTMKWFWIHRDNSRPPMLSS